jgi:DNA-3-methyladenine glycosylase
MEKVKTFVLGKSFYCRSDVTSLARLLLGKYLFTSLHQRITGGQIIETEAYAGVYDRASHAWAGRRTKRTGIMYEEGGIAYVYLCYGIHSLFNIVTNKKEIPDAILIRGLLPTHGIRDMEERLERKMTGNQQLQGPGLVSKALGITTHHTGLPLIKDLHESSIWVEDRGILVPDEDILTTPRIGVEYAGPHASLPYRYVWAEKKADSA